MQPQQKTPKQPNGFKNVFYGTPTEHKIPRNVKYIVVADFFASDLTGGAELTTEAIIESCPDRQRVFRIHSVSVTPEIIEENSDKIWILTNFSFMSKDSLCALIECNVSYSVVEYDFKFCKYRSASKHFSQEGFPCNCSEIEHGQLVGILFENAKSIHWMSEKQRDEYFRRFPDLTQTKNYIQSSVFSKETLDNLIDLRKSVATKSKTYAHLGSGSWIKGCDQTAAWLRYKRKRGVVSIPNLPYSDFLKELAKHEKFVFMPLDYDTCPRTVIEAKLLGCDLVLNKNVLHKDESWFSNKTSEEVERYLRESPSRFWAELSSSHMS